MIEVAEASRRILQRVEPLSRELILTSDAAGRVLAERLVAPVTSPPWDNASMDGYAVRSADILNHQQRAGSARAAVPLPATTAGESASAGVDPDGSATAPPLRLRVTRTIAAGQFAINELSAGEAARIMTGAPIPPGADTVIRKEDTDEGHETVSIHGFRDTGKNVRRAGEDFRKGDLLFASGDALRPAHLGVLASAGIADVEVHRRPLVAIISSGDELIELSKFSPDLAGSKIVSSNSITLASLVRDAGGIAVDLGIARDDPASVAAKFEQARESDLIVTSAGVSVGEYDHMKSVFAKLGGELLFWKVRMRPGAPLAFGTLNGIPWLGVSGNPVSAIVSFEVFIRPVIRRMLGFSRIFRRTVSAHTAEGIQLAAPLMHFLRAVLERETDGTHTARLAGSQSSAVLTAMARANALLILPGTSLHVPAGTACRALTLGDDLGLSSELELF